MGRHLRETSPTRSTRAHENVRTIVRLGKGGSSGDGGDGGTRGKFEIGTRRRQMLRRSDVNPTGEGWGGGRERRKNESRRVPSAPLRLFLLPALPHPRGRVVPPLVGHPFFGKGQTRAAADFGTRRLKSYEPRVPIARVSPSPRAHMREGGEEGHQD